MAKGYGIILVMMGHCDMPYLTDLIYAFHMPLFFFLSGYVFHLKTDIYSFLSSRIKRMIVPYLCLCIPMIIANLFFFDGAHFSYHNLRREIVCFALQERYTTLWFLACLFILNLFMFVIVRFFNREDRLFSVVFLCIMGILLWRYDILVLPWNIDAAFIVIPFFYVGYELKTSYSNDSWESWISFRKNRKYIFLITSLLTCIIVLLNSWHCKRIEGKVDLFYSNIGVEWLMYLNAFIGIAIVVIVSRWYYNKIVAYIGKNSLLYFAWHQSIVFPLLSWIYWKSGITQWTIYQNTSLFKWFSIVATLIIITIVNELIIKSKLKFMLGR